MNAADDLERQLADHYASEAPTLAPDWLLSRALAVIDSVPQQRTVSGRSWRIPRVLSGFARPALIVVVVGAAVAAIGLAGLTALRPPSVDPATVSPAKPTAVPSPRDPVPTPAPTPVATTSASPTALPSMEPVAGTDLPLAGREGAPGPVGCGRVGPTTYEALTAGPVGAERLVGPEYDVLRETIAAYGDDPEFAALKAATFREFRLDDERVEFLGDIGSAEGTFPTVSAAFDGVMWRWAGMDGACVVTGQPGAGWGSVNWTLDPAFDALTVDTRQLRLLATEAECTRREPLDGRLGPAYVFLEPDRVRVQLFARTVEVGAACDGIGATAVTLRLPEPLDRRPLEDANPVPCRGCGG